MKPFSAYAGDWKSYPSCNTETENALGLLQARIEWVSNQELNPKCNLFPITENHSEKPIPEAIL